MITVLVHFSSYLLTSFKFRVRLFTLLELVLLYVTPTWVSHSAQIHLTVSLM